MASLDDMIAPHLLSSWGGLPPLTPPPASAYSAGLRDGCKRERVGYKRERVGHRVDPPRPPQTLSGPALVPPVSPRERPGTRHGRPESAQVHTRDTPSAPKHAKDLDKNAPSAPKHAQDLDKDAKGHTKAALIAPIVGNTIKTNVFF